MEVVRNSWSINIKGSPLFQVVGCLRNTKNALKCWNKQTFGKVQNQIAKIREVINVIQNFNSTTVSLAKEKDLQSELDKLHCKE